MRKNHVRTAGMICLAVTMLCLAISQATATSVTIVNPSFEDESLPAQNQSVAFPTSGTTGWIDNGTGTSGAIHPYDVRFPSDGFDGVNVMYVNSGGAHQTLSLSALTLQADTELTLSVRVGDNFAYPPTKAEYGVGLTFKNRTVTPTPVSSNTPNLVSGGFVTWTFTYDIPGDGIVDGVNVVGQNATIELFLATGGNQINFDVVTLDVIDVPEPASVGLMLLGAGWLLAWRRKQTASAA